MTEVKEDTDMETLERDELCRLIEDMCPQRADFGHPIGSDVEKLADAILARLNAERLSSPTEMVVVPRDLLSEIVEAAECLDEKHADKDYIWEAPAAMSITAGTVRKLALIAATERRTKYIAECPDCVGTGCGRAETKCEACNGTGTVPGAQWRDNFSDALADHAVSNVSSPTESFDERDRQSLERVLSLIAAKPEDYPDDHCEYISLGALRLLRRAALERSHTTKEG